MAQGHQTLNTTIKHFEPSSRLKTLAYAGVGIGVLGFAVGLIQNSERLWPAYLTAFFFVSCLSLGGLFFAAINHITKAGWSSSIRRIAEGTTAFIPLMVVSSLVLLVGLKKLYPWARPEVLEASPLIASKTAYLNPGFMVIRLLVFGFAMWLFSKLIVGNSLKQDASGDESLTHKNVGLSIAWVLVFAIGFSLFSVDVLMSLMPTWYSTIWGIYCFAGLIQSFFAFFVLALIYLRRQNLMGSYLTTEHIHDCAKFLKGFTVFWAYIAFSQFMLIWYANLPEETEFYILRAQNGWTAISVALLVFKFVVPFLALLPRWAKRTESHLIVVCSLILVMQYLDIFWMVFPNFNDNHFVLGGYELSLLAGFVGLFLLAIMKFYRKNSLVAVKDPRLHEALNHHVLY